MRFSAILGLLDLKERITLGVAMVGTLVTGTLYFLNANHVLVFFLAAVTMAALASAVGDGTNQIGHRLGPNATGVLQSALGNLPELFISIFALRAGLVKVVQAALVGSILGNSLLVLGLAFIAGGLRHGTQKFGRHQGGMIAILTLLSVAALTIPTLATQPGMPAATKAVPLSVTCAVVLLIVFAASIPFSLRGGPGASAEDHKPEHLWPLSMAVAVLAGAGVASAVVSDWFVNSLGPTMQILHMSESFTGLVIVAIAGNAVENVVGVQMAARNQMDFAISVILNSSLQVAVALIPALVIISQFIGGTPLTLVLPPLLLASLALAAILGALIVYDGESTWLEGVALVGLYVIIAASFWWG